VKFRRRRLAQTGGTPGLREGNKRRGAALAAAEPIPVQPGVEAGLGVAALITGQGAAGGAGVPAGAGDGDRAGFAFA
jgi:hypothetical protein